MGKSVSIPETLSNPSVVGSSSARLQKNRVVTLVGIELIVMPFLYSDQ
jgi:hypothetical protein